MVTAVEQTSRTGNDVQMLPVQTQTERYAGIVFRFLATLFVAGIALQFFIVGVALFVDGARWNLHQMVGHGLGIVPLLMLGASLLARLPLTARLLSALLLVQVVMQQVTVSIGDWAGAFHPLNAILMFAIGLHVRRNSGRVHANAPVQTEQNGSW